MVTIPAPVPTIAPRLPSIRRAAVLLTLTLALLGSGLQGRVSAAPDPTPVYTPAQIQLRVDELQAATLAADQVHVLDPQTTRALMTWTKDADGVLRTLARGWRTRLAGSWLTTKDLVHTTNPPVLERMAAIDAVLGT